ncbi:hypothetical protein B0H19DRAFT_657834 [Mycena capillaripes]|nr:hypothetical protein B0H19DRAFT_657834 [Mycena capillaripes]
MLPVTAVHSSFLSLPSSRLMASPQAAGPLVPYVGPLPLSAAGETVIFNPIAGRTLYEVYSTVGQALETHTNRMAHRLGLGPEVVAQKIAAFFGTGEERQLRLTALRNAHQIPAKLEKDCSRLMRYTLPTESPKTQRQAFERIVALTTLFPGLRLLFLCSSCIQSIPMSKDDISGLWDRSDDFLDPEWSFWRAFAATCLSETGISAMLEETSVSQLADCLHDNEGLSVIERLLIAHGCETGADSKFCNALSIRYLVGILQLPGFWSEFGSVHGDIARKLCLGTVRILKDISLDILPSEPSPTTESPFDYEG